MKKNVFFLGTLCLVTLSLIFSGCKKENNDPQEPAKVQTYKMSIQASKGADSQANGPRRVLSLDGTTLNATWQAGEQVSVYNATKNAELSGYLVAQSSGASTQLTGELTGTIEVGDELTLKYLSPNYADQEGTIEYISENCDYAIATDVEVTGIVDETIYTDGETTFENQQAVVEFNLKDNNNNAAISASELIVTVGTATSYTVTLTPAASKLYVAIPGFAGQTVTLTATVGSDTYAYEKAGATFANGKFYQITAKLTKQAPPVPEGAISGKFSVSSTKQVYFAKGNLKYTKSGKFEFMTNQYDMVETRFQNVGNDYASQNVISLFGWATSNINTPKANEYYYPWETDPDNYRKYGSGITSGGINWSDNNNAFANYDWGENTADLGTGWRTLTKAEWEYLFNINNASTGRQGNYRFAKAKLFGTTCGIILFPDGYTHPDGVAAVAGLNKTDNTSWNGNMYNATDWKKMEDAGCVFLPAAGYRKDTSVEDVGSYGGYWSSTSDSSVSAYYVGFSSGGVNPASYYGRYYGLSVRLVKNVE